MKSIELPSFQNVVFTQKYYRRYSSDFTNSNKYKTNPKKYDSKIKQSHFFFGSKGSLLTYMKRKNAVDKSDIKEGELKEQGMSDKKILEYMRVRPGSTGLFDSEGSLDKDKVEELNKFLSTTPNMGWSCVMSFLPEYSNENVDNPYQAQKLLSTIVPEQLKLQGLDPKDYYWFGAYHTNTDHRHIHYVIVPKEASTMPKAFTDKDIVKVMPSLVEKHFPLKENHFPIDRDYFMEEYSKDFEKISPTLFSKFNDIIIKKKQYKRLNKEERQIVNSVTWNVLNRDKNLKKGLEALKGWAKETEEKIITHKNSLEQALSYEEKNFAKITYYAFMNRIYNRTLKLMNEVDHNSKSEIEINEQAVKNVKNKSAYIAPQSKEMITNRSMYRRKRYPKEKISSFIRRLISESANYALFDLNGSFLELWDELNYKILDDSKATKEIDDLDF